MANQPTPAEKEGFNKALLREINGLLREING